MQTGDNIVACVTKSGSDKSTEVSLPATRGSRVQVTWLKASRSLHQSSKRSPSIQSRPLSLRLRHFWSPKKGSEEQMIHLGWRRQAVCAELVHNTAPGILRDYYSPPCVSVGQQPGPILLTYRYWFLFLGLQLVSFWMPLIYIYIYTVIHILRAATDGCRSRPCLACPPLLVNTRSVF